ncbi:MAG: 16S rRNA (guanine(966)-N(2))-methyltransferase RsmD [Anaerolineae bacterium]|jgi:16S rRNA (guanine(966)-N(2))-methyltransferase RsmD
MRVISGTARGRKLRPVPGDTTRPITDRAKEALFDILGDSVRGARVLDLFAGTGGVGIEALSRGADSCLFIDKAPAALHTIRANLDHTGLADAARIARRDAFRHLRDAPDQPYDLIYVAPPQYKGMWRETLEALDGAPGWLADAGTVVVQIHPREEEPLELRHLVEDDRRKYGSVMLLFYSLAADATPAPGDGGGDGETT